ncbi:MAG: hypothetical protein ACFCU9_07170 [Cyanophyceae cyanobacterium]
MAWVFSLSAECGAEQISAEYFAHYFEGLSWPLSNGNQSQCHTAVFQDSEENWWCQVCPSGISEVGIDRSDSAYQMTELGILLYQRLQSAPPFRYALVGVEVDEFRTYGELISEASVPNFPGLVLAEPVWRSLGASTLFRPFSAGYVWQPYEGEVYKPLMVSLDLKNKLSELLVLK